MIMKLRILILSILSVSILCVQAQQTIKSKFKIGDNLPDFTFTNMINYSSKSEKLSTFRGTTVVLYFWNEGCSSSIEDWPKLLKLQDDFARDVKIILVNTTQGEKEVTKLIRDQQRIAHVTMNMPVVCLDVDLNALFSMTSVPHLIWIDKGKLIGQTSADQLTPENLTQISQGKQIKLKQKDGVRYQVDFSKPLFVAENGGTGDHLLWQSVLSRYYPGIYGTMYIDSCSATFSNSTVVTMFRYLFKRETSKSGALNLLPEGQVELKVRDTLNYAAKVNGEFRDNNFYSYHLYSKTPQNRETMRNVIFDDMGKYFGVNWYWKKAEKQCLVLSAYDTTLFASGSGELRSQIKSTGVDLNNITIREWLDNLVAVTNYQHSPYPLVDETGYKGTIRNISFEADIQNYAELNTALNSFGLQLSLERRMIDILVLYERDYFSPESN